MASPEKKTVSFEEDCIGVAVFMGNGRAFYLDEASTAGVSFTMTTTQREVAMARLRAAVRQIAKVVPTDSGELS